MNKKISVIICSIDAGKYSRICENYKRLLSDTPFEIIGIHDAKSLAEGYNRGFRQSTGEVIIFSHDDILIIDDNFGKKIVDRLNHFDLIGFAGASRLVNGQWIGASNQHLHGVVAHSPPKTKSISLNVYGVSELEWPVISSIKVVDGLCMIAHRRLLETVKFDANTFDGFHLYDLDLSFSAYLAGFKIGVCCDIPIIHESGGSFDHIYRDYALRFQKKHGEHFDPSQYARPSGMPLGKSCSYNNTEELLSAWHQSSLKQISESKQIWPAESFEQKYQDWLNQRRLIPTDTAFLESQLSAAGNVTPCFHFIIRLPAGFENLLADTIDSLGQQVHDAWQLDVISTLPSPDGLDNLPNIGWHTLSSNDDFKISIDNIAVTSPCNWLIEIPAGARLDILYLCRLAKEISSHAQTVAFFVDDDCCDKDEERNAPRFKPGINHGHLLASDLAGPLCVRKDAWISSGGAAQENGSPWFDQLLRITDKLGWVVIQHIPDVLITYSDKFPSAPISCQRSLRNSLQIRQIEGEIIDVSEHSWDVRYALKTPPEVTIAILSIGQLEFLPRCLDSIIAKTRYPAYEVLIVTDNSPDDPEIEYWLKNTTAHSHTPVIRFVYTESNSDHATRCNLAIASSKNDLVVLVREEAVFVQDIWLEELVRSCQQQDIGAASPLIHQAGDAKILNSGNVLGLLSDIASPYSGKVEVGDAGYLDCLLVTRDVSTLPSSCLIIHKDTYLATGGMDEDELGDHYAEVDLCLKIRKAGKRLVVHPRSSVVYGGDTTPYDLQHRLDQMQAKREASRSFRQRWGKSAINDRYWNPNLSLSNAIPQPEAEFRAQWQYLPSKKPRILAHPLGNGQGDYRIVDPLSAVRKAGLAQECIWRQYTVGMAKYFTSAEISRLEPTTVIAQNYIHDLSLMVLDEWSAMGCRPFIVYALDDLINDLDKTNPFRQFIPPNARSRLKYALARCDRLVVSTNFLAETYQHFIPDIRVVPNRLQKDIWCVHKNLKRTSNKPRIGWAGGTTHQGDLLLLKEIIEQTRHEADWIFFGMCPVEIRPLLAEYHELVPFNEYPAYLASLNLDIAVAPLAISPFNQGKSNLRLLEYGALGIPVVCTNIDPYHNSPACRVENSPEAWIAALRERIYDAEGREREGLAMRNWVLNSYVLEDHLDDWLSAHLPG